MDIKIPQCFFSFYLGFLNYWSFYIRPYVMIPGGGHKAENHKAEFQKAEFIRQKNQKAENRKAEWSKGRKIRRPKIKRRNNSEGSFFYFDETFLNIL